MHTDTDQKEARPGHRAVSIRIDCVLVFFRFDLTSLYLFYKWQETGKIPVLGKPTHIIYLYLVPTVFLQCTTKPLRPLPDNFVTYNHMNTVALVSGWSFSKSTKVSAQTTYWEREGTLGLFLARLSRLKWLKKFQNCNPSNLSQLGMLSSTTSMWSDCGKAKPLLVSQSWLHIRKICTKDTGRLNLLHICRDRLIIVSLVLVPLWRWGC